MNLEHKKTIENFNAKIEDLESQVSNLQEAKEAFMVALANAELNGADAAHRCRCGDRPRDLIIPETWECETSPVGVCVYDDTDDPMHDQCLFCGDPEERK